MVPGFPETCDYGNQVEVVLTIMEEVQQTIKHQSFKLKPLSSEFCHHSTAGSAAHLSTG